MASGSTASIGGSGSTGSVSPLTGGTSAPDMGSAMGGGTGAASAASMSASAGMSGSAAGTDAHPSTLSSTMEKAKETASSFASEASDAAAKALHEGKDKAGEALASLARMIEDAARVIEEKAGPTYGGYAKNAASGVSGFAQTLQSKNVDELMDDARTFVRKSPGATVGAAAAVGFLLTRIIKLGADDLNDRA